MPNTGSIYSEFVGMAAWERVGVMLLLAVLVLGIGVINFSHERADLVMVWLAFLVYALVLLLPFLLYRSSWGWFHPLVFMVLWWQLVRQDLPRLGIYAEGLLHHRVMMDAGPIEMNAVVVQTLLLTSLGLLAFYVGFIGAGRLRVPRLSFAAPRFLLFKVAMIGGISACAFLVLTWEAGGIGTLLLQRGLPRDQRIVVELGGGHWHYLVGLLKVACLLWLALRPNAWRNPVFLATFIFALAIDYIGTGSRSGIIMTVAMAGAIWMLNFRRVPYSAVVAAGAFALLVVGIGGELRMASRGADSLSAIQLNANVKDALVAGYRNVVSYGTETDGTYGIVAVVPQKVGFLYGQSYLSIPFAPVPSALLPFDKPQAGGRLNAIHIFGNPLSAIPPGNIGEAYWNFHVPGVFLVMLLFGVLIKWFVCLFSDNQGSGWVTIIYVYTLFLLQPNSTAFYGWLHAIVPIVFFILLFCGMPRRMRSAKSRQDTGSLNEDVSINDNARDLHQNEGSIRP